MADAAPIKAVFNASNVATGLAEFQASDTVALSNGGLVGWGRRNGKGTDFEYSCWQDSSFSC